MQQEINKDSIVLLPTEQSKLAIVDSETYILSEEVLDTKYGYQSLFMYIIDKDAPIKEGLWIYSPNNGAYGVQGSQICKYTGGQLRTNEVVIIATNDPKLIADGVAGISDEFIRQWVGVQGKEYKVMMEMVDVLGLREFFMSNQQPAKWEPKLSESNELILSIVEESKCEYCGKKNGHWAECGSPKAAHSVEDSDIEAAYEYYLMNNSVKETTKGIIKSTIEWYKSQRQTEAIAFAEWLVQEGSTYYMISNNRWYTGERGIPYTTEQLYQEWLKTKSK